jgi:acyl-CoA reductase-like NAD-dependent aldehyde dehydrogenase
MFINGQWETGSAAFAVYNPATGEEIGRVPDGTRADAARAIDAAGMAFASWSQTTACARAELLYRALQLMRMLEGLRFAIVGINDINPTAAAAPFGGMQESGLGREGGQEGIAEYLEVKLAGISM